MSTAANGDADGIVSTTAIDVRLLEVALGTFTDGLGCNGDGGAFIDVPHFRGLSDLVGGSVLQNAEGVDPEILKIKFSCPGNGV